MDGGDMPGDFDGLRIQGRRLEKQIFTKLGDLSALNIDAIRNAQSSMMGRAGSATSLANEAEAAQRSIEELLDKLLDTANRLDECLPSLPQGQKEQAVRTNQRYREIHRDYLHEFNRTRAALQASIERAELFSGDMGRAGRARPEAEMLLGEQKSLHSSIDMVDELIGRADATREGLVKQRAIYTTTAANLDQIAQRFPLIRDAMIRIRRYKQRDMIVLAVVIATCILFTLWYVFG
ncbi:Golgi SNAP receptor complex member 1 [Plasmodiophora brassicae]|uniref:Golgi SNAP receptor complex member 1 n=1 Tax=Plasmodiophora brassicae TaxID=37360 RepID=A0A0G4J7G0_PLABS|nr:hypothetical protein PBRA_003223 [Plasmodiophora brassicae]SPQ95693.1 unnamed protein product [Plasmodiophora brassicae]